MFGFLLTDHSCAKFMLVTICICCVSKLPPALETAVQFTCMLQVINCDAFMSYEMYYIKKNFLAKDYGKL